MAITGYFSVLIISIFLIILLDKSVLGNSSPHRRFEYKYSFKPPYLAQKDGSVPFWEYGGNAIASSESVRVAPSLRSQKGAIWTKSKTNFDWWEVEIVFRITGRGRIGADGLAFWYTTEKGDYSGPVYGSSDRWTGLGVFFDSFDNDNKHNNPYIMAVLNDGTKVFDHQNDGATQMLGGCLRDFRNKPFPIRARIEYYQNVLTIYFHDGLTNNVEDYQQCVRAENIYLPKNGYFGISAATGGLADDHDVFQFLTTSLSAPGQIPDEKKLAGDDSDKLAKEYQDYQKKMEKQKEEYRKEHPEAVEKDEEDMENWFETDNQRELRQIFQGQVSILDSIREVSRKIDEVAGRASGGTLPQSDVILNNQNILSSTLRDIHNLVSQTHALADKILTNQARAPTAHVQATGYDVQSLMSEMRDGINQVKQGMAHVASKVTTPGGAPLTGCPTPNCLSLTAFLIGTAVQLSIIFLYQIYKSRSEAQAKKFY